MIKNLKRPTKTSEVIEKSDEGDNAIMTMSRCCLLLTRTNSNVDRNVPHLSYFVKILCIIASLYRSEV